MEEVKVGLRLFIYATYNSESFGSPPGIQLIFAKLSLTEELTFTKAGTTRGLEEEEITQMTKTSKALLRRHIVPASIR